ncbi:MAG: ATP-grasp domain-containing protein [Myxococcales bacterium]|nr:ATP-grasp domain-containing protein [Myxococcales bacterium]
MSSPPSAPRPIRRLAIVNRGEAAVRCIRTVKSLRALEAEPLEVVALYTGVDRDAPFVRHADMALRLPERASAVASYLDHDLLIEALHKVEADAVWPGWGFVAESPSFVDRLDAAGIRFLGPSGDTMRRLGDKIASKELAEVVGVPVTPWSGGVVANVEEARQVAERIGLPLVIKASAGGGGRGIRMVREPRELAAAFESAASEAKSAFGDNRLFMETMVASGRHIEVQIVADTLGNTRAVGCRDCSVQRRHQKVLEEAPPLGLSEAQVRALGESAETLAREVGYAGVGTVEFLVQGEHFYFLEMNPRLQVEHGITEAITGLDLVEQQIRIARGESIASLVLEQRGACIEARVCAEDPDQGFLPAPGRIACFDPALGPDVRVDAGVVAGSSVPPDFDSLIAKVMARGDTREQARARLSSALHDFDLVIDGGATNKGYLLELLDTPDFREGGVDTLWLDRWNAARSDERPHASQALVLAAILAYRNAWQAQRGNFYADTSNITPDKIPVLDGKEVDLEYRGEQYRMRVFSVGALRYRVHLDGKVISARFGQTGEHTSRVVISARYYRATHNITPSHIRLEVEGVVHRFGRRTAGQVRAGAPSMVVSVDVQVGDRVAAGQPLGLLEAMKMEIAFASPVAGVVKEVRVSKGQQVAAGELLLSIDPARDGNADAQAAARLRLPQEDDPLAPFFEPTAEGGLGAPDLEAAQKAPRERRELAMQAVNEEIERTMLGFDIYPPRFERILDWLEAPLPAEPAEDFLGEQLQIAHGLLIFADLQQLFSRARRPDSSGALGPSNNARLRVYLRRMQSEGAGIAPEFLDCLRAALAHYDVYSLKYDDDLERAVLRSFAAQRDPAERRRLAMAVLRRLIALMSAGVDVSERQELRDALLQLAEMRGEVSNALADTALEAYYRGFQAPELARQIESTTRQLDQWLSHAEGDGQTPSPPAAVLEELSLAPRSVFRSVEAWLHSEDRWKQVIALSAFVRRLYSPRAPERHRSELRDGRWLDRSRYDGKAVVGAVCRCDELETTLRACTDGELGADIVELLVVPTVPGALGDCPERAEQVLAGLRAPQRVTLSLLDTEGKLDHISFEQGPVGLEQSQLYGLHPEVAERIDLARYRSFELERLWGPEDIYCFHARARADAEDERLFVLGDVRGRPAGGGSHAESFIPLFEQAFQEAARTMRLNLGIRDPRRTLHWNRIVMHMAHPLIIDALVAQQLARKLLVNIRYLGLEKTIVRLKVLSEERPEDPPREVEVVGSDLASSRLELSWRRPRRRPLVSAIPYERRVATARRRGLVYPYEIIRMLTSGDEDTERAMEDSSDRGQRPVLPVGQFEEYDLRGGDGAPHAVSVMGRTPGENSSAIVFGVITTPTHKVPEGMKRVLVLSDPTRGMGALAAAECDRVVAAIDLATSLGVPVEWIPISSGARIAMDSGTENLDATARVVRRIVEFTQAGGVIHLIVTGVNVGAQSYWDSLSTMLMHTRGVLIMTPEASMVLTGRAALAASGSVSAEDEVSIGGHERVMGPNGQAQYYAPDLLSAYQLLYRHYAFTYVVPGERGPRKLASEDPKQRDICDESYVVSGTEEAEAGFARIGDIFDDTTNPGRKRAFAMRALMRAVVDADGDRLERWQSQVSAETAIVWDAHLGGHAVCLVGIESQNVARLGYRPSDGPESWNGGTLFPQSSKKVARALNAASGNRPAVILANLSGFDGSPESMRKLQLEYGAEIARAVVNFQGPIVFLVVSRYHGGAYVVFSRELKSDLRALAVEGSFASVIGGGPAAAVVFPREVRARVSADPRIEELRSKLKGTPSASERAAFERLRQDVTGEKRAEVAAEFDAIHSVQRAREVGSLEEIISASKIRARLVELLDEAAKRQLQ